MRAPHGRHAVGHGQCRIRVLRDVGYRKIVRHERVDQDRKRAEHEDELDTGGRARQRDPVRVAANTADERKKCLDDRDPKCEREHEMTDFGNHCGWGGSVPGFAAASALATSGGM